MTKKKTFPKDPPRFIHDNFAEDIKKARIVDQAKPSNAVIFFRDEHKKMFERKVVEIPINLLRFRSENGRIASDVLSYEKDRGPLDEKDPYTQDLLFKFLIDKDPEKTNELKQSIRKFGQLQPAIITADGFLINGNRRKAALQLLYEQDNDSKWERMKVVILPGKDSVDDGGPPTLKEIEQIENRYQMQSEGKSEYSIFDRALSIRRKIRLGISLKAQLKDDPVYAIMETKEFERAVIKFDQDVLAPLVVIDKYLEYLDRPNIYSTIAAGKGDKEGRWYAFKDLSSVLRNLANPKYRQRREIKINENELGSLEEIAFKIIRKRQFPELPKVHQIIRNLPKYLSHQKSKDALFELLDMDFVLTEGESKDKDGNEYDEQEKDKRWGAKHGTEIIKQVRKADELFKKRKDKETPLKLLGEALKKLQHNDMQTQFVVGSDVLKARYLAEQIEKAARELRREFFEMSKNNK